MTNNLYAVLSAVMPGVYRLITIYMLNLSLLKTENSLYVSLFMLATGLCMFSGLGLSTSYIKEVGGLDEIEVCNSVYFNHLTSLCIISLFLTLGCTVFQFVSIEESLVFLLALFSISIYQIERHYYLANNNLRMLFKIDIFLLCMTVLGFIVLPNLDGLLLIGIANILVVFLSAVFNKRYKIKVFNFYDLSTLRMGIKLGYSNLVSGGVMYILPTLMLTVASERLVTILSIVIAVSGAVLVLPRAVINTKLKKIASDAKDGYVDNEFYEKTNKLIAYICFFSLPIIFITSLVYLYVNGFNVIESEPLIILVIISLLCVLIVGQLSLVDSMLVIFLNKENISLIYNTVTFLVLLCFYMVFSYFKINSSYTIESMLLIVFVMFFCYVIRLLSFRKVIKRLRRLV